ncbi:hypothetical protein ABN028_03510 [Actinopolymorpha sp. B17G11]|uniref:hypothetical protein n=1 Tax=unclassified Actinopolymorpha TaxID=2627063 RepID=UPI0032E40B26
MAMIPQQATEDDAGALREQRRRIVLRHVRSRAASRLARRSAVIRTAVLLRSIGYHDER